MAIDISTILNNLQTLSFSESLPLLKSIILYIVGISIYSVFIFKFYRFIAKKDVFDLNLSQYNHSENAGLKKTLNILFYILEYLIIFPILTALWFVVLFVLLVFLSKNQSIESILLTSMAIIAIVRITSYYDEDLSKDLAKMLPFTLLGIFLVDSSYFSISTAKELLLQVPQYWHIFAYYFVFIVLVEFVSRIGYIIISPLFSPKEN